MRAHSLWLLAILTILCLSPSLASAGAARLKKTGEAVVASISDGTNIVRETRTVSIQNTQVSDALQVAATMSATQGSLLLQVVEPVASVGTVPGASTVTSTDTYTVRRGISPTCPLCSPWNPDACQPCGLSPGTITALISELPPDAPVIALTTVTNNSLSGTVSACTRAGVYYPTCIQQVRLVPDGQSCTANPIAFSAAMTASAQSWTITGLSPSTSYAMCGAAGHDATVPAVVNQPKKGSTTPNRAPNAPAISGVMAPNSTQIRGNVICVDDGLPLGNPCNTTIKAIKLPASGSCSSTAPSTTVAENSQWEISVGLQQQAQFRVYASSSDGALDSTCTGPIQVTMPKTADGCIEHETGLVGECGSDGSCSNFSGASAAWQISDMYASDWQYGGFSLAAVWLGVNESKVEDESIEVGVSHGWNGLNQLTFYTAWQRAQGDGYAQIRVLGAVPSVGGVASASVINCKFDQPNTTCKEPWSVASEREHMAMIGGISTRWDDNTNPDFDRNYVAPSYGGNTFVIGTESTCNTYPLNGGSPSRMNTTTFEFPAYRWLSSQNWVLNWGANGQDHYLFENPVSSLHEYGCCGGSPSGIPHKCNLDPSRENSYSFFSRFNSLTPAGCQ